MKLNYTKHDLLRTAKHVLMIVVGTLILSFGTSLFMLPYDLVTGGVEESVKLKYEGTGILLTKNKSGMVEEKIELPESVPAPVKEGDKIGEIIYSVGSEIISKKDIVAVNSVKKAGYTDLIGKIFKKLIMFE